MESDRLGSRRLPQAVVLEQTHAAVAHQLRGKTSRTLRQHLRGDHVVGSPPVADLAGPILRVSSLDPIHLVGLDPRLVRAFEQRAGIAREAARARSVIRALPRRSGIRRDGTTRRARVKASIIDPDLRARSRLLGIVEREAHDGGRDPLLQAVELADLDLGAELVVSAPPSGRARCSFLRIGDRVPLVTTPTCWRPTYTRSPWPAVSLPSSSSPTRTRCGCAIARRSAVRPTKSSSFVQLHGEPDAGLERVHLVVELVARERSGPPRSAPCPGRRGRAASGRAAAPASQTASHTAGPSSGWHQTS